MLFPLLISKFQPVWGKERFEDAVKKVVGMGFDPTSFKFVQALHVVYQMSDKTIQEKVGVYKSLGFAVRDVSEMFKKWPLFLAFSEKKISQTFETLKKFGLVEDEILSVFKKFPQCISYSDQNILNSLETFLELGFSRDEFVMMVKCFPQCIAQSVETVKKKTEFVVKKMDWPLKAVALFPRVMSYSMEKRIVPRCNVIKALMSKGLLGRNGQLPPLSSVLATSDERFLNLYVMKQEDKKLVAELLSILTRDLAL